MTDKMVDPQKATTWIKNIIAQQTKEAVSFRRTLDALLEAGLSSNDPLIQQLIKRRAKVITDLEHTRIVCSKLAEHPDLDKIAYEAEFTYGSVHAMISNKKYWPMIRTLYENKQYSELKIAANGMRVDYTVFSE